MNEANSISDRAGIQYVGFWARLFATLADSVLLLVVIMPLLYLAYGGGYFAAGGGGGGGFLDVLLNFVLPIAATLVFWRYKSATPGKMLVGAVIVDADSLGAPSMGQLVGRYFAYIPSMLALGLGFLWIAWDPRKQSWHDKLAGTVVVRRIHE